MFKNKNLIKDININFLPGKLNNFIFYEFKKNDNHKVLTILNIKIKYKIK